MIVMSYIDDILSQHVHGAWSKCSYVLSSSRRGEVVVKVGAGRRKTMLWEKTERESTMTVERHGKHLVYLKVPQSINELLSHWKKKQKNGSTMLLLSNQAVVPSCLNNVIRRQAGLFPVETHRVWLYDPVWSIPCGGPSGGWQCRLWALMAYCVLDGDQGQKRPARTTSRTCQSNGSAAPMGEGRCSLDTRSLQTEEKLQVDSM